MYKKNILIKWKKNVLNFNYIMYIKKSILIDYVQINVF